MTTSTRFRDQVTVLLGITLLSSFVVLSWVPRSCPVIRQWLIGCPHVPLAFQTPAEQEVNRVPHQTINTSLAIFSVKSDPKRTLTRVFFPYQVPSGSQLMLQIKKDDETIPLALVTHPLLLDLTWSRTSSSVPDTSLYQRNEQRSLEEVIKGSGSLAADAAAARIYQLPVGRYQKLESLTSLDGIDAILTTYIPGLSDGSWKQFEETFNLQDVSPDTDDQLHFSIQFDKLTSDGSLLLGDVHVDYRK